MPILAVVSILLQIACITHAVRSGRVQYWPIIILIGSFVGCLAYFLVEILPEIRKRAPEIFRGWDGVQRGAKAMPARADEQGQEKQGVGWYERLTAPVTKDDAPAKRWLESTPGAKGLGAIIRRELGGP